MGYINKKNKVGSVAVAPILAEGELAIDLNPVDGDVGRVYVGDGAGNVALAKKSETDALGTRLDNLTTSDVAEGTNLYYTDERVDDRVASLVQAGTNVSINYNDTAGTLTISANGTSVDWGELQNKPTTISGYGITDAQPLDATLTALAALTTAANQMIYSTGANAVAMTPLTAFARTLLDDADAATARTTLGLAIGTNVQAYDATLAALAALTTAANKLIYATGADTFSTTTLSAFARTLLDDADAATMRTTLGINVYDGGLGYGQTWQNVTASRALGVTYTNSTGKPIEISVISEVGNACWNLFVNGVLVALDAVHNGDYSIQLCVQAIIPNGATYSVTSTSTGGVLSTLSKWYELR